MRIWRGSMALVVVTLAGAFAGCSDPVDDRLFEGAEKIGNVQSELRGARPTAGQAIGGNAEDWSLGGVGVDAQGDATVIYRTKVLDHGNVVVNQRKHGAGWGTPVAIDGAGETKPASVNGKRRPFVAVGPDGDAHALWTAGFDANYKFSVKTASYDARAGWSPAQSLVDGLVAPEINGLVSTPGGGALAIWDNFDDDGFVKPRVSQFTSGAAWATPQNLASHTSYGQAVAANASGAAVAVWVDKVPNLQIFHVMAKRFTPGTGWDADAVNITDSGSGFDWPAVSIDAAGNAVMVVMSGGNIVANHLDANAGWGAATVLGPSGGNGLFVPSICMNDQGRAYATWTTSSKLHLQAFDPATGWSEVTPPVLTTADETTDTVHQSQCALDHHGRLTVADVILSHAGQSSELTARVWAQTLEGTTWKKPERLGPVDAGWDMNPSMGIGPNGAVVVAWEHELPGEGVTIWATRHKL